MLQHGSSASLEDWREFGYVEALKRANRLILIDARGHGESDKPHDVAIYDIALKASDVVAVLDELGVREASYMGYSLGDWIGFGVVQKVLVPGYTKSGQSRARQGFRVSRVTLL